MHHRRPVRYARLKVVLLFAIFAAPIVTAWGNGDLECGNSSGPYCPRKSNHRCAAA